MNAATILNQAQAEAVYSAMCHLNNVCGGMACTLDGRITIQAWDGVIVNAGAGVEERYPDQSAFATAYGLLLS